MGDAPSKVQEAIELQRGAIAAEIHDSLLPYVFATRMRLETLLSQVESVLPIDSPELSEPVFEASAIHQAEVCASASRELKLAIQTLQQAMLTGRELISQLYPTDMALSWFDHLTHAFERLTAHDASQLIIQGDVEDWIDDPEQRLAARRIAQEAVRNAVRHGKASEVVVVATKIEPCEIQVAIRDNGIGFEPMASHRGFGLRIMQMRATQVGATVSIDSKRGGPTMVTLTFGT